MSFSLLKFDGSLVLLYLVDCRLARPVMASLRCPTHSARAQRRDDFVRPEMSSGFQAHYFFPVGTRRLRSSNQFKTTFNCVADSCSLLLSIRNRCPSGLTS